MTRCVATVDYPRNRVENDVGRTSSASAGPNLPVFVATDQRFVEHRGMIYAVAAGDYSFWTRYLDVFSAVNVVARIETVQDLPSGYARADGANVSFLGLPYYVGPRQAMARARGLVTMTRKVASQQGAYILRVPGLIGMLLYLWLRIKKRPFAVEVVGDPQDSLSPMALRNLGGALYRPLAVLLLKLQCRHASCAAYVTAETLQRRYPPGGQVTTHYSSVELTEEWLTRPEGVPATPSGTAGVTRPGRLIFIGSFAQRYKGLHVLLQAIRLCCQEGMQLELEVLGDGAFRPEYEQLAARLGLNDHARFLGYVPPGRSVQNRLLVSDLFVMPSLVEGLPRAMLEAMACGLACVGSRVGGIPELLPAEDMVPPNDPVALARKIQEMMASPDRISAAGQRNRATAQEYATSILRARRNAFYQEVHRIASSSSV
jgi:glycosyltransferase involved in cell wall biosynthesis